MGVNCSIIRDLLVMKLDAAVAVVAIGVVWVDVEGILLRIRQGMCVAFEL